MMRKICALLLAAIIALSFVACGKSNVDAASQETDNTQSTVPEKVYGESDPAAILEEITNDFVSVTTNLTLELEHTFDAVGATYEEYQENKGFVDEWVELALSESDALFARTREKSIIYFKLIAANPDIKYSDFCEEALDEYHNTVYEGAMDEYYNTVYEGAMDDLYNEYYGGIVDDASDVLVYGEWSKASSEAYKTWSDANSAIYKKWSEENSYIYGLWSAMDSAFYWNGNYDVDTIVADYETNRAEEEAARQMEADADKSVEPDEATEVETDETANESTESEPIDGVRPEFKEAMDTYEAFMVEYCDFMVEYQANPSDLTLLAEYSDMLIMYSEVGDSFAAWSEEDLSDEELLYFMEVSNRINLKLTETSLSW